MSDSTASRSETFDSEVSGQDSNKSEGHDNEINQSDILERDTSDLELEIPEFDKEQLEAFIHDAEKNIKDKDEMFKNWQNEVSSRRRILQKRSQALLKQKKNRLKTYEEITGLAKTPSLQNVK